MLRPALSCQRITIPSEDFDQHGLCLVELDFDDLFFFQTLQHIAELLETDLPLVKIRVFLLDLGLDDAGVDPVKPAGFQLVQLALQDTDPVGLVFLVYPIFDRRQDNEGIGKQYLLQAGKSLLIAVYLADQDITLS